MSQWDDKAGLDEASLGHKFIKARRVLCANATTIAYCDRAIANSRRPRDYRRDLVRDLAPDLTANVLCALRRNYKMVNCDSFAHNNSCPLV